MKARYIVFLMTLTLFLGVSAQKRNPNITHSNRVSTKSRIHVQKSTKKKVIDVAPEKRKGPVAQFSSKYRKLGKVELDSTSKWIVIVKNVGDSKLIITEAKSFCGCTTVDYTKDFIAPGDSGRVEIGFHAESEGVFMKSVNVYTNCESSKTVLSIEGEVVDSAGESVQ